MVTTAPEQQEQSNIVGEPRYNHISGPMLGETNITYDRADGQKVEASIQHPSMFNSGPVLILAQGTEEEYNSETAPTLTYSREEILLLRQFLNSPHVSAVLGVEELVPQSEVQEVWDMWEKATNERKQHLQELGKRLGMPSSKQLNV